MTELKSKKDRTQDWLQAHLGHLSLRCHHCHQALRLEGYSLVCPQGHRVDSHKQGTYFLSNKSVDDHYDRQLFQARRRFIQESAYYAPLQDLLNQLVSDHQASLGQSDLPYRILDAGSGEGSHLAWLLDQDSNHRIGLGVDLARAGIALATDFNGQQLNLVGDLAQLPIGDQTIDGLLSILSPSNYQEFDRVLAPGGRVFKVIPNAGYLAEIRRALGQETVKQTYDNQATRQAFESHYRHHQTYLVQEKRLLTDQAKADLVSMTPLTWHLDASQASQLVESLPDEFLLDVAVLVGWKE